MPFTLKIADLKNSNCFTAKHNILFCWCVQLKMLTGFSKWWKFVENTTNYDFEIELLPMTNCRWIDWFTTENQIVNDYNYQLCWTISSLIQYHLYEYHFFHVFSHFQKKKKILDIFQDCNHFWKFSSCNIDYFTHFPKKKRCIPRENNCK